MKQKTLISESIIYPYSLLSVKICFIHIGGHKIVAISEYVLILCQQIMPSSLQSPREKDKCSHTNKAPLTSIIVAESLWIFSIKIPVPSMRKYGQCHSLQTLPWRDRFLPRCVLFKTAIFLYFYHLSITQTIIVCLFICSTRLFTFEWEVREGEVYFVFLVPVRRLNTCLYTWLVEERLL